LKKFSSFLDVGANEGYFSVLASTIVGTQGYVAAIEPQSKLCEIIRINTALNGAEVEIFNAAFGGAKGDTCELNLYPSLNTGAASVVRSLRFYRRVESANFVDPVEILGGRDSFAFVKVDVEGYEREVVKSLLPLLQGGRIRMLLLDYHAPILHANGIDPSAIEKTIFNSGMSLKEEPTEYSGYRLYSRK
jgi:FkbM family methyltransferase